METSGRNRVTSDGGVVTKVHGGPDGATRAAHSVAALGQAGAFGLPVPEVRGHDGATVTMVEVQATVDGADLLESGPARVLSAIGGFAHELHALPPPMDWPLPDQPPATFVHGDLCPVNTLFDGDGGLVAVLDWEEAHMGEALDDLAWTEWLVRTWHPEAVEHLPVLYAAYGEPVPDVEARRAAMGRCLQRHDERGDRAVDWAAHLADLPDLELSPLG